MTIIKLSNRFDAEEVRAGGRRPEDVRTVSVDALVDTGATMLVLPRDLVDRLGLAVRGHRRVRYANGTIAEVPWVDGVGIEIVGRETTCNALVEAPGTTPLIGQIPLEELDLVVDPRSRDVRANPASPDAPVLDLLHVA